MRVAIHQPNLLPWLPFFEKMDRADVFLLADDDAWSRYEWHATATFKHAPGKLFVTLPSSREPIGTQIRHVEARHNWRWLRKFSRTMELLYGKAPYFDEYWLELEYLMYQEARLVVDLTVPLIRHVAKVLGISTPIRLSSELGVITARDQNIIDQVRAVGGDAYYTGEHGWTTYMNPEAYEAAGIRVEVQQFRHVPYRQQFGDFVPGMSVLDLLFNVGPMSLAYIREGGKAVSGREYKQLKQRPV